MTKGEILLGLARGAIAERFGSRAPPRPEGCPWLDEPRAVFVTLKKQGALRGCIGQLVARAPLVESVKDAARSAAFRDTRFPPLDAGELDALHIEVSVLGPLEPLDVHSEEETVRALRPGVDGVLLTDGSLSAVFIPEMWKELPDPHEFLWHLRRKGRLPVDHWPSSMKVQRFTAELYEEPRVQA